MLAATFRLALAMAMAPPTPRESEAPATARTEAEPDVEAPLRTTSPRSTPVETAREPVPHPELERPVSRGVGLLATGSALGGLGFTIMFFATARSVSSAKDADREAAREPSEFPDESFGPDFDGTIAHIIAAPLLVTSAGLLTAATSLVGKSAAYDDVAAGRPYPRGTNVMIGAGAGAVALGTATIITTRLADGLASTHLRAATMREAGLWTGTAAILAGAGLLGYGVTYRVNRTMLDRAFQAQVAPVISRELVGVGVSGRF
jgi:hypothetical protein